VLLLCIEVSSDVVQVRRLNVLQTEYWQRILSVAVIVYNETSSTLNSSFHSSLILHGYPDVSFSYSAVLFVPFGSHMARITNR
jgi:hypothetical protein